VIQVAATQSQPQSPPPGSPAWMGLAMRAGWWGVVGMLLAAAGELVQFVWPDSTRFDNLTHAFMWFGAAATMIGLQAHAKRATDIAVNTAADSAIDRAQILDAVTPKDVTVTPSSSEPVVQKEIEKRSTQ
jgi:hypothetical protein